MWRVRVWRGRWWHGWWWAVAVAVAVAAGLGVRGDALAPLSCPSEHALQNRCSGPTILFNKYKFTVDGQELEFQFEDTKFIVNCRRRNIFYESAALPRFKNGQLFKRAVISSAKYPLSVLCAINITVSEELTLRGGKLRNDCLNNLNALQKLQLESVHFEPSLCDLSQLKNLVALRIGNTHFTAADLEHLPTSLTKLQLFGTKIGLVPAAALARLRNLTTLQVSDEVSVGVEAVDGLQVLSVVSDVAAEVSLALPRRLADLTVTSWAPPKPLPWEACANLTELEIIYAAAEVLPDGWLANCSVLRKLTVTSAKNLTRLEKGVLRGAAELTHVSLTECPLEELPDDLLKHTPNLLNLDLSDNHLYTLPSNLLVYPSKLRQLSLSYNRLNSSALDVLKHINSLELLRLNNNSALDACPDEHLENSGSQQGSVWRHLSNLNELNLSYTNTSLVCVAWRNLRRLGTLHLEHTAIVRLERSDLQFNSAVDVTVWLTGAKVTTLSFEQRHLEESAGGRARGKEHIKECGVSVQLSEPLRCDCDLYWAAAALRRRSDTDTRLRVEGARCADGRELRNVSLDELVCRTPAGTPCPEGCACSVRPDESPPERVLRLDCERAGLSRVPSANRTLAALAALAAPNLAPYALDLRLAHNTIDALDPADLPPELALLDLRNNSLSVIDENATRALVSQLNRRVKLAGNPLECGGCRAAAMFAAVRSTSDMFADRDETTCVGGERLVVAAHNHLQPCEYPRGTTEAGPDDTGPEAGDANLKVIVAAALAVVATVAAALVLALLRPELRLRAKAALRAWGLLPRAREIDDGRVYDAFVSFAHADVAVVREMVSRLESGATPLRLCVHYRDWMPGGWIPTQIAASVRVSRRTVAVVSAAFLRSEWARAEFREAYAAALRDAEPRLVVVLLEDPARLPLDAELRAYLAANTYVRWDDPWFWPKLRRALPAPRPIMYNLHSTDVSSVWDVVKVSNNAPERSGMTVSTDTSDRFGMTASNDAPDRCGMSASNNASERSGITVSTDASECSGRTGMAETLSTDASGRSAGNMSTDVSAQSATTTASTS